MKVLLVQANVLCRSDPILNPRVFPLGLSYVGTALKDHDVVILDPSVLDEPLVGLREKVVQMKPDVVGFSLRHTLPHPDRIIESWKQYVEEARKAGDPALKIMAGGPAFSLYPERLMEYLPGIDYGIFCEGEETTPELLENLENPGIIKGIYYRKDGQLFFTGAREKMDFGSFPAPRRDLIDIRPYLERPYIIGVQSKRGCILKCVYCSYPRLDGCELRLRHPEHVADEIERLIKIHGIKSFAFTDNVFNVPIHHAEEICREMIKRKLPVRWTAWFHDKFVTRDFMELARDAGCDLVEFSSDGFSDQSLERLGKKMTNRDIVNAFNIVKDIKEFKVRYHFFFWPPGQRGGAFLNLLWFKLKVRLKLGKRLTGFGMGPAVVIDNTKLYEVALEEGLIDKDTDLLFSVVFYWPSKWTALLFRVKSTFSSVTRKILGKGPHD